VHRRAAEALYGLRTRWGVEAEKIDWPFFESVVAVDNARELFQRARRARRAARYNVDQNERAGAARLRRLLHGPCRNVDVYKTALDRELVLQSVGQKVLEKVLGPAALGSFHARETVVVHEDTALQAVNTVLASLGAGDDASDKDISARTRSVFALTAKSDKCGFVALKRVLGHAFEAAVYRGAKDSKRADYKTLHIEQSWLANVLAVYTPAFPDDSVAPEEITFGLGE
jgi:hypothetical protein